MRDGEQRESEDGWDSFESIYFNSRAWCMGMKTNNRRVGDRRTKAFWTDSELRIYQVEGQSTDSLPSMGFEITNTKVDDDWVEVSRSDQQLRNNTPLLSSASFMYVPKDIKFFFKKKTFLIWVLLRDPLEHCKISLWSKTNPWQFGEYFVKSLLRVRCWFVFFITLILISSKTVTCLRT